MFQKTLIFALFDLRSKCVHSNFKVCGCATVKDNVHTLPLTKEICYKKYIDL